MKKRFFLCAALVLLTFLLSSCVTRQKRVFLPTTEPANDAEKIKKFDMQDPAKADAARESSSKTFEQLENDK